MAKKEQDEKKERMQRQPDVKEETLKDPNIGFHRTSDELSQFQTPILIPHADEVLVNVHEFSKQLVPHRSRGRRSKQLGHIEAAEECHIEVVVEEVTKCDASHHVSILRQCQCMMCDLQLI